MADDALPPDGDPVGETPDYTPEQLERRRRLIDAAFELGAAGGYEAVHMRDVAATANVALATIYRNFTSKDHLLAEAMSEWTGRLRDRVAQRPPKGDNPTDQMIDVLDRACATMARQPKLSKALVRAMASPDAGVRSSGGAVRSSIADVGDPILAHLDADTRADILAVLGHVWYSALITWANGRTDFDTVADELHRACRVLISPYNP
ncbi:MAG: TetR family transcriptional regulator [Candidatus Microthrix sp.]|uniref:Putative HTH-type transcriptional repressor KstR n=1 Tax=Candidatus Neomicrothrix parvicella RN1 TaxID=1229780 RepID=R4YX41_9ACTN|nr:TetR/AcrR family transcriptional regulator [Candidatus Microthrix sp.]MBK7321446.1 TetR family transcriptional regulator [Candidatus Microthrix sp.]MBP7403877.1 TetR family transcriptional regulator [Candidatus Microthrix sp.]CCM62665.1 putative HTH-type transcriptional repressor KstR [Candidatus Microthrix parvicella RN1]HBX08750.1 TetR/AcrR family transcriptional regulator [Candidatus Microthrix parvicella]